MSLGLREDTRNVYVGDAVKTMDATGHNAAARQFEASAPRAPVGMATTSAMLLNSNPGRMTGLLGSVAPEFQSREMSGMFRLAGLGSMMTMLQGILPMFGNLFSGIGGNVLGALGQSQGLATMGNTPGSPQIGNLLSMLSIKSEAISMRSIEPKTGMVGAYGAPAVNSPPATQLQQNTMATVPGMAGPSMSPPGM
ncbi:MAG: hypothetical protein JWO78_2407 [Micavibrio sp.]|nr:hypothetical protein [Micavibrio sp.]